MTVRIPVGNYDVVVGDGVVDDLVAYLSVDEAEQIALIASPGSKDVADRIADGLFAVQRRPMRIEVPDGEAAKDLRVAERVWQALGQAAFARTDLVVGVGGGAVTDLAGFVAATWLRGVHVIHVPTTLLGMVDAAIGGKTAINIEAGKNLVGAFHQPELVAADPTALATLPQPEYAAGLAEVVKAGFIADPAILELVERDPAAVLERRPEVVGELVERSVRVKASVVSADPLEVGKREILNYGHTLAHAIEKDAGYGGWRHGDAVAVGLCYAAAVARRRRFNALDDATADRHRAVLTALGLPTTYAPGAWPRLREAMRVDKKRRGSRLRFIVLDALAHPVVLDNPNESLLESAYEEVSG